MGGFPRTRITVTNHPFGVCGVDYTEPIQIKESKSRGWVYIWMAFVTIFVFFQREWYIQNWYPNWRINVLYLHSNNLLESTPYYIYSNNATTFVGAKRQLQEVYEFMTVTITLHLKQHSKFVRSIKEKIIL